MTTFIFKKGGRNFAGLEKGNYSTIKIFYEGLKTDLSIAMLYKLENTQSDTDLALAIKGEFKEEVKPFRIELTNSYQIGLPQQDNWETFLVNLLLTAGINELSITEYAEGNIISTRLEEHYIRGEISKEKDVLNKLEFGRYLPIEKPEYKRKSTSWTKGVFVNDDNCYVKFMQTSWDGETGNRYNATFDAHNKRSIIEFLSIPIENGWTEIDYKLGSANYYKAGGQAMLNGQLCQNTFVLKDVGEQDMPFVWDRFDQYLRTKWADCFINNFRRHVEKIEVLPIRRSTAPSPQLQS